MIVRHGRHGSGHEYFDGQSPIEATVPVVVTCLIAVGGSGVLWWLILRMVF